jgi:hypothetical protein
MATATRAFRYSATRHYDHVFFSGMAVLILATVFLGFVQSFYLAGVVKLPAWKAFAAPPLPLLVQIHGAVFSSWIVLLIAQTSLVAAGRVDLHRRLGLWGFGLACLLVLVGLAVTCENLARHFAPGDPKLRFPFLNAVDMLVFSTLIYFGYRQRFSPAAHKRLVLTATITLLDAAFLRWPVPGIGSNFLVAELCCYSLLLLLACYDLWSIGKVHHATLWGSTLLIVTHHPILSILGQNIVWHSFAIHMQTVGGFLR